VSPLLEVSDLVVTFGGLRAVDSVGLQVEPGRLVGLIGPNGAGKTTFIDALTGFVPCTGRVVFDGRDFSLLAANRRAHQGLARTWQSLELFDDLTIAEHIEVAAERHGVGRFVADLFRPRAGARQSVPEVLTMLGIGDLAGRMPGELSHGQRKLAGIARALAGRPHLVCMDEPAAGLDAAESAELGRTLRSIVDEGTSVLLVDHDMGLVLQVCDYIYVLEFGQMIAQGTPKAIRDDERVIAAYLGEQSRRDIREARTALSDIQVLDVPIPGDPNGTRAS